MDCHADTSSLKDRKIDYVGLIDRMKSNRISITRAWEEVLRTRNKLLPPFLFKYMSFYGDNIDDEELNLNKLNSIRDRRVHLSAQTELNDPFDCKGYYYDSDAIDSLRKPELRKTHANNHYSDLIRMASFTENGFNCMPMWAHYANNHQGICLAYDVSDVRNRFLRNAVFPVQYTIDRRDLTQYFISEVSDYRKKSKTDADKLSPSGDASNWSLTSALQIGSFIKQTSWSYEAEWRCCISVHEAIIYNNGPVKQEIDATPSAIYIGWKREGAIQECLISIGNTIGIPVYKMTFDDSSPRYELVPKLLN